MSIESVTGHESLSKLLAVSGPRVCQALPGSEVMGSSLNFFGGVINSSMPVFLLRHKVVSVKRDDTWKVLGKFLGASNSN